MTKTTLSLATAAFLAATSASNAAVTLTQVGITTNWDINIDPSLGDTVTVSGSLRFSSTVGLAPVAGPVNAALWNSSGAIQTDVVSVAVPELSTPPYWASVDSP